MKSDIMTNTRGFRVAACMHPADSGGVDDSPSYGRPAYPISSDEHSISIRDLLIADYGEFPLPDVETSPLYKWPVASIRSMSDAIAESRPQTMAASYGYTILLRPEYYKDDWRDLSEDALLDYASSAGHEGTHILQNHFNRVAQRADLVPEGVFETANALLRAPRTPNRDTLNAAVKDKWNKTVTEYFIQPHEIQARIHEIMAWGYQSWGRLPLNKSEFFAALVGAGLNVPDDIRHDLENTEEGKQALSDFTINEAPFAHLQYDIDNLNLVFDYAETPELQSDVWNKLYLGLYANLLEMYGDKPGRSRFDLGESKTPLLVAATVINQTSKLGPDEFFLTPDVIEHLNEISLNDAIYFLKYTSVNSKIEKVLTQREDVQQASENNFADFQYPKSGRSLAPQMNF